MSDFPINLQPAGAKYQRTVFSCVSDDACTIDVYSVLDAFEVNCPARAHAIKKLLLAGERGVKSCDQDLEEAKSAIMRAIQLEQKR